MKKLFKLLIPILSLALLVGALCVLASAADEPADWKWSVTASDGTTTYLTDNSFCQINSLDSKFISNSTIRFNSDMLFGSEAVTLGENVTIFMQGHNWKLDQSGKKLTVSTTGYLKVYGGSSETDTARGGLSGNGQFYDSANNGSLSFYNIDVTTGSSVLFDLRGGEYTFDNCTFTSNGGATVLRFAGNASSKVTASLTNCAFVDKGAYATQKELIRCGRNDASSVTCDVTLTDCRVTADDGVLFSSHCKTAGRSEVITFTFENTVIDAPNSTLFCNINSNGNFLPYGVFNEGTVVNVKDYYAGNTSIDGTRVKLGSADLQGVAYDMTETTTTNYMVVSSVDAVTVTFKSGETTLGERVMARGVASTWNTELARGLFFDGKQLKLETSAWTDEQGNTVTALLSDSDATAVTLYAKTTVKTPKWATFTKDELALENIAHVEYENNNIANVWSDAAPIVYLFDECIAYFADSTSTKLEFVIDLNGNKLTVSGASTDCALRPAGSGMGLTIRNGEIIGKNGRIFYNGTNAYLNVYNCTVRPNNTLSADLRGSDIAFENCTFIIPNDAKFDQLVRVNNHTGAKESDPQIATYTFKNITVKHEGNGYAAMLVKHNQDKAYNVPTVILENITVEDGAITETIFGSSSTQEGTALTLKGYFDVPADPRLVYLSSSNKYTVTLDNLALAEKDSALASRFVECTIPAGIYAYNGTDNCPWTYVTDGNYETATVAYPDGTLTEYTIPGVKTYIRPYANVGDKQAKLLDTAWYEANVAVAVAGGTASYTPEYSGTPAYAILTAEGDVVAVYLEGYITPEIYALVPDAGYLCLYTDVASNSFVLNKNGAYIDAAYECSGGSLTVELNGNTLDMCNNVSGKGNVIARFTLNNKTVTINNGKLCTDHNVVYSAGDNGRITFNNVDISAKKTSTNSLFDLRGGNVIINGGSLSVPTAMAFIIGARGGVSNVEINGAKVTCDQFIIIGPGKDIDASPVVTVSITDAQIKTNNDLINIRNKADVSTADITFKDSELDFATAIATPFAPKSLKVTLDETASVAPVVSEDANVSVVYGNGQTLLTTDDATYTYKVGKVTLGISSNLTLYSDFNLNLFLGNNVTKVMAGETELALETVDETTVKASLKGIAPNTAGNNIVFTVTYVDGGVTYTASLDYSVVKYAQALLAGDYSDEAKALVASAVKYIDAAYAVAKAEKPATLTALIASESYKAALATASDLAKGDIDGAGNYTNLAVAVNSAQLRLSDDYKYVLNLNESYTGTLTVNGVAYSVVNGTVNGKTYVTVTLRGYEFNNGLTVTATTADGTVEGVYTLADYVEAMANGTDADLDALLVALYNFTVEAKEYNEFVKANGLK